MTNNVFRRDGYVALGRTISTKYWTIFKVFLGRVLYPVWKWRTQNGKWTGARSWETGSVYNRGDRPRITHNPVDRSTTNYLPAMDNVARSVLTDQLNLLDKKDRLLEDNPDLPPDPIVELGPQFYVEHRIKQVFGTKSRCQVKKKLTFRKQTALHVQVSIWSSLCWHSSVCCGSEWQLLGEFTKILLRLFLLKWVHINCRISHSGVLDLWLPICKENYSCVCK